MRVAFYTIGCKLNQFETEYMREQFEKDGWETVDFREMADVYVINTCTVTAQADAKSRQSVRQALKRNPDALVVATGCYSQINPEALIDAGAHVVTGNPQKVCLKDIVYRALREKSFPMVEVSEIGRTFHPMPIKAFSGYSRAFIKVQDGCNRRCSYCIVWKARGPSRCASPDFVLEEARRLVDAGFEEIVLTGTHLGTYRIGDTDLVGLLERLCDIEGLKKIRLSSIEPTEFSPELIDFISSSPKIAKHLHIPMQSGSERILKLMNRPYSPAQFRELVEELVERMPTLGIGVDVIVGFPTETEEDFEQTYHLLEELPIYYMHIFSYSPRPGTPAASMKPQVRPDIKRRRWETLNRLKQEKKRLFIDRMIGQRLDCVIEGRASRISGFWRGLSENYIPLLIKGDLKHLAGKVVKARLIERTGDQAVSEILL